MSAALSPAEQLRDTIEGAGFTVTGLPADLTWDAADGFAQELLSQIKDRRSDGGACGMSAATIETTLPAVVCEPWCIEGSGHVGERFPADQTCVGEPAEIHVSRYPLIGVEGEGEGEGGGYVRDWIDVRLWRSSEGRPHVRVGSEGCDHAGAADRRRLCSCLDGFEVELTKGEALALADALRSRAESMP